MSPPLARLTFCALVAGLLATAALPGRAQTRFMTRYGLTTLFSATPIANIEARNAHTAAILALSNGQVAAQMIMSEFEFERQLMQQHFNESYLETDKYPKAVFTGKLVNYQPNLLKPGSKLTAVVEGQLAMHGVSKPLSAPVYLEWKDGHVVATTRFVVMPADYNIEIPLIVRDHIAKSVDVQLTFLLDPVSATPTANK